MIDKKFATHERSPFFAIATPYIKPESKVLDIGPGSADFSDFHRRTDFYLFEGNPVSVEYLKKKHPNTFLGQLPKLPFADKSFDVIHCSHVVEHLEPQVLYDSLVEMDRCLADGGVMVISAPMMWEGFYNDLSHVRPYNPSIFRKYLCKSDSKSLTREFISDAYQLTRIQYRYFATEIFNYNNSRSNFVVGSFLILLKVLRKLGLKRYVKSGYTVVLSKDSVSKATN